MEHGIRLMENVPVSIPIPSLLSIHRSARQTVAWARSMMLVLPVLVVQLCMVHIAKTVSVINLRAVFPSALLNATVLLVSGMVHSAIQLDAYSEHGLRPRSSVNVQPIGPVIIANKITVPSTVVAEGIPSTGYASVLPIIQEIQPLVIAQSANVVPLVCLNHVRDLHASTTTFRGIVIVVLEDTSIPLVSVWRTAVVMETSSIAPVTLQGVTVMVLTMATIAR